MICLFGAKCQETNGQAQCVCDQLCDPNEIEPPQRMTSYQLDRTMTSVGKVCGSDSNTYENECHLKLYSCRIQESIMTLSQGQCKRKSV